MRSARLVKGLALGATLAAAGCAEPVKDVDRTQPNALSKDLFKGTWYFARTVVDAPYETQDTFVGDRQEYLFKEDFPAYKVRWRIEEDHLLACRVDEVVINSNSDGVRAGQLEDVPSGNPGQTAGVTADRTATGEIDKQNNEYADDEKFPCRHPIASFAIQGHFDIQRNYNSATGEQSNVIDENASDRPWYQRQYIRVDWTDLGLPDLGYNLGSQNDSGWLHLSSPYYVQAEDGDCRTTDENGTVSYKDCDEGFLPPVVGNDAILITNRVTVSAANQVEACFYGSIPEAAAYGLGDKNCALNEIGMRLSFMRAPDSADKLVSQIAAANAELASEDITQKRIDELEPQIEALQKALQTIYVPKPYPDDAFERFGLWRVNKATYLPGRGETDFRQYLAARWNVFQNWRKDDGTPLEQPTGFKAIDYYLNREFPSDLKPEAFRMAKEWSDAYDGVWPDVNVKADCKATCQNGSKPIDECTGSDTGFKMVGQCPFNLHENNGEMFLGDLRYSMIAFIQDPSYGQPCGVGGPANDPETGEMLNGVAYVYGNGCFDYLETRVLDMVDLLCAQHAAAGDPLPKACATDASCVKGGGTEAECTGTTEDHFIRGKNILDIMQAQGYVQRVPTPIQSLVALTQVDPEAQLEKLQPLEGKLKELSQNRGRLHGTAERLKTAGLERMMIPDEIAIELSGGRVASAADLSDEEVARINPLDPIHGEMLGGNRREDMRSARAIESAEYLFNDNGLWALAKKHMNLDRTQFRQFLREQAFRAVTLHELGHNMGLRHNFIASFDRTNYFPDYWKIKADVRAQFEQEQGHPFVNIDSNGKSDDETEEEFAARVQQWSTDREIIRKMEEDAGIKEFQYSSIMDYHQSYYGDWQGLGNYDKAAMRFAHTGQVDRLNCEGSQPEECDVSESKRTRVQWYGGGQLCYLDTDRDDDSISNSQDNCPDNANRDQADGDSDGVGDACDKNSDKDKDDVDDGVDNCKDKKNSNQADLDEDGIGDVCDTEINSDCPAVEQGQKCRPNPNLGAQTCTSWDEDELDSGRLVIRQKFCSDERVDDQPFCNRFDEGDSSEEIVRNMIEQFEAMYPFRAFRRNNTGLSAYGYYNRVYGMFRQVGDQMQSMLYKYFYEPGFRANRGPGGFDDMFRATVVGFDFLGSVLARPDTGFYKWNEDDEVYRWDSDALSPVATDDAINVPLGQGKPLLSVYERGYFGEIERLAYVGSYYEKMAATDILTRRDFGTVSGNDERFQLSFYDFFPTAFTRLMSAQISGDTKGYGMNYDPDTKLLHPRGYWDGSFFDPTSGFDPTAIDYPGREIEPRTLSFQPLNTLISASLEIPYYADSTFLEKLRVFELGGETGFDVTGIPGVPGVPGDKLVTYTSPLTHRTFAAVETEEIGAISVRAVNRAKLLLSRYETAIADGANQAKVDEAERNLRAQEDLLAQMTLLVDLIGISRF